MVRDSASKSTGEAVERGETVDQEVYKKYWLTYDQNENRLVIEEFQLSSPDLRPDLPSKLVGYMKFDFVTGVEDKVEVK